MSAHSLGVAFGRREQETGTSALELAASDFAALVIVLERHQRRYGDHCDFSLTPALRSAERGLALCNQLLGSAGRE